jgi:hypothetical protein
VMAYIPTVRTVTVDMGALGAPATGHWYDPSSGDYTLIAGSPLPNSGARDFTPPGNNRDGDGDWLLVLETNPPPAEATARTYTTDFPATEDPISEDGRWLGGQTVGLAWADFRSTPGLAFGKQLGTSLGLYDDSIALLAGTWGPDQTVQATVKTLNQDDGIFEELELRLRSTVTPGSSTGYECLFSARSSSNAYVQIVRWNGPFADFTLLDGRGGSSVALNNGDTIQCTIHGSIITAYINGVEKLQVVDSTYASGNPGIGAYLQNATGVNADYGFTSLTASDALPGGTTDLSGGAHPGAGARCRSGTGADTLKVFGPPGHWRLPLAQIYGNGRNAATSLRPSTHSSCGTWPYWPAPSPSTVPWTNCW